MERCRLTLVAQFSSTLVNFTSLYSVVIAAKQQRHDLPFVLQRLGKFIQKNFVPRKFLFFPDPASRKNVKFNGLPQNGVNVPQLVVKVCSRV